MEMTENEICREYRMAKKKRMQIGILADQNMVTREEIEEILKKHGLKPGRTKKDETENAESRINTVQKKYAKPKSTVNISITEITNPQSGKNTVWSEKAKIKTAEKKDSQKTENPQNRINTAQGEISDNKKPDSTRVSGYKIVELLENTAQDGDKDFFPNYICDEVYPAVRYYMEYLNKQLAELEAQRETLIEEYARLYEFMVAHGK